MTVESDSAFKARQIEFPMTITVCAWCKQPADSAGLAGPSHGICPRHMRRMRMNLQKKAARRHS